MSDWYTWYVNDVHCMRTMKLYVIEIIHLGIMYELLV